MLKLKRDKVGVDLIFILILFGVFILSAIFVILFGSRIYKRTVDDMDNNFSRRTATEYITEKLHRNDFSDGVCVSECNGIRTLRMTAASEPAIYYTYIYYYDGYLREITQREDYPLNPETGTEIMKISDFSISSQGNLFDISVTDENGTANSFRVSLRSCSESGVQP